MQNVRKQNVVELCVGNAGGWAVRGVYPLASMPPNWQRWPRRTSLLCTVNSKTMVIRHVKNIPVSSYSCILIFIIFYCLYFIAYISLQFRVSILEYSEEVYLLHVKFRPCSVFFSMYSSSTPQNWLITSKIKQRSWRIKLIRLRTNMRRKRLTPRTW